MSGSTRSSFSPRAATTSPPTTISYSSGSLLDGVRRGERDATPALLDLLLRAGDVREKGIAASVDGTAAETPQALLEELDQAAGSPAPKVRRSRDSGAMPTVVGAGRTVRVALKTESVLKGARALLVLR